MILILINIFFSIILAVPSAALNRGSRVEEDHDSNDRRWKEAVLNLSRFVANFYKISSPHSIR